MSGRLVGLAVTLSVLAAVLLLWNKTFLSNWLGAPAGDDRPTGEEVGDPAVAVGGRAQPAADRAPAGAAGDFRLEQLGGGRTAVAESVKLSQTLVADAVGAEADLEAVDAIFGIYRWAYQENPEGGDNREITGALTGNNPRNLVFIPADHPRLNAAGELLDRWGSPYFFHKISDQVIDVVSAGPDRRQWSADDLSLGYTETYRSSLSE